MVKAAEAQLNLLPVGIENLIPITEEARKAIYDESRKPPEGTMSPLQVDNKEKILHQVFKQFLFKYKCFNFVKILKAPKWRVGGVEFEALMRMLDNAGYRTGYIYRNPLVKHEPPRPKHDIEVPPAVSSLGYLLEEEEMYKSG